MKGFKKPSLPVVFYTLEILLVQCLYTFLALKFYQWGATYPESIPVTIILSVMITSLLAVFLVKSRENLKIQLKDSLIIVALAVFWFLISSIVFLYTAFIIMVKTGR